VVNLYRRGRIAERKVANLLERRGFTNIRRSAGSRGPADLYARKEGIKYYVQVKSGSARVSRYEVHRLKTLARKRRGVALVAHYSDGKVRYRFYGNWSPKRRKDSQ